jgi:hypothetical protein
VRITSGDAVNPVLSSDGQLIVYGTSIVAGAVDLRAVRLDGTPVALPPTLRARPGSYRFVPGGTRLIYLPRPQSQDFSAFDVATGKTSTVTALADLGRLRGFDISPDGKRILFDRSKEQSDVVLITPPQ